MSRCLQICFWVVTYKHWQTRIEKVETLAYECTHSLRKTFLASKQWIVLKQFYGTFMFSFLHYCIVFSLIVKNCFVRNSLWRETWLLLIFSVYCTIIKHQWLQIWHTSAWHRSALIRFNKVCHIRGYSIQLVALLIHHAIYNLYTRSYYVLFECYSIHDVTQQQLCVYPVTKRPL